MSMTAENPALGPPAPQPSFPPEYVAASNASRIVGVVGLFHVLALTTVALRIYARVFVVKAFGADDGLIIATVLLALGSWICLILQVPYGLGRHGLTIPSHDRVRFEEITFWKTVLSDGVALGLLRISMAISLLRLKKDLAWYRWSLYGVMGFVVLYSIQAIAWLFVYCTPFSGWWEFQWMNPFDSRCHDFNLFVNLVYWNVSCHIFTDVLLGTLPIPIIWSLKMKLRIKLYVIGILNLGYFAILMGILKAVFMLTTGGDPDQTFDYWVHFWQNLQLNIGIIAACASFLKPLLGRVLKLNSTAGRHGYSSQQYKVSGGRAGFGTGTIGSGGGTRNRARADGTVSGPGDDVELHDNMGKPAVATVHTHEQLHPSRAETGVGVVDPAVTRVEANGVRLGAPSPATSMDMILGAGAEDGAISFTRTFSVKYSNK
ncbi:hypothetical protein RB595_000020 [Gaeumannomyces hyphopodioides]